MKSYNFEERNKDFDATVRLDKINEEVRKHEKNPEGAKTSFTPEPVKEKPLKHPKKKKPFRYFTIIIIIICVAAFVILFSLAYKNLSSKASDASDKYEETLAADEQSKEAYKTAVTNFYGFIKDIPSSESESLTIYDISKDISRSLFLPENISLSAFSEGDIVNVSANLYSSKIESMSVHDEAFKLDSVSGLFFDENNSEITYENKKFHVSKEALFVSKESIADISELDKNDIVTVCGIDNTIYYISAEKLHGSIFIENSSALSEGKILIDDDISFNISDNLLISVSPGSHKLEISGTNINTYSTEVFISSSDIYNLDISKIPHKTGALSIKANVSDFYVSIDDGEPILYISANPIVIPQGEHKIYITKDGYAPFEDTVSVLNSYEEINVALEKASDSGALTITSQPEGADVYINDDYAGPTPLTVSLTYDTYRISVEKKGYKPLENTLEINKAEQSIECILTHDKED